MKADIALMLPISWQSLDFDNGIFELDPVCGEKTALVMVPWYLPNAAIHYIDK